MEKSLMLTVSVNRRELYSRTTQPGDKAFGYC
jgi:hypothetical protein